MKRDAARDRRRTNYFDSDHIVGVNRMMDIKQSDSYCHGGARIVSM
jgi:hypothetical protein